MSRETSRDLKISIAVPVCRKSAAVPEQLRLYATRQKMLTEDMEAASASFDVGYVSPSRFNREYKQFFAQSPIRDIQDLEACV
jgi:transcriptional regulator GlxA family with amidase domain